MRKTIEWEVEQKRVYEGHDDTGQASYTVKPDERTHTFSTRDGCNVLSGADVEIREEFHYPGGPGFGVEHLPKAKQKWPTVTVIAALPHGRLDLREALTTKLKETIKAFVAENGL